MSRYEDDAKKGSLVYVSAILLAVAFTAWMFALWDFSIVEALTWWWY